MKRKKPKPKIESIEEYLNRGGQIQKADFSSSHDKFTRFGRSFKDYRKQIKIDVTKTVIRKKA